MIFKLSLKFNRESKAEKIIEARNRADLDEKIKTIPFWHKNKDRMTVDTLERKTLK